ncbi:unnamed protein product [Bursaphelenchus okinawaensis]|uniref:Chloride channel CLIC-like protein 1 n=1 Tax=Bursaphelenchus okinawaensis TaxID=465554 RepID=A0A811LJW9_9BILA|nr:unnamed protein product [Bursaphelenchus okinawaensis]CAG9125016.1 unnamed protein product [Bursaphelenchus okinawaensis]
MAKNFLTLTLFLLIFQQILSEVDNDESKWLDVHDPLSWDQNSGTKNYCQSDKYIDSCRERLESLEKKIADVESEDVLLRQILRQFLQRLNINLADDVAVMKDASVYLSLTNVRLLKDYLENYENNDVHVRERMRSALSGFIIEAQDQTPIFMRYLQPYQPYLILLNISILPIAVLFIIRRIMSPRQLLMILFMWAFCVSFCFTYARKYKEKLAERYERSEGDTCIKNKSFLGEVSDVLLGYLRIKGKSDCLKKYEDILIEPILLIDPLATFGEVLANFFLSPLEVSGKMMNKFFNDFFVDTPLPLAVFKVIFLFLLLFFFMGYRLRTLFFSVEPVFRPQNENLRIEQVERESTPMIQEVKSCPTLPPPVPPHRKPIEKAPSDSNLAIENLLNEIELPEEGVEQISPPIPRRKSTNLPQEQYN